MKRCSFIVQRQRVASALNPWIKHTVRQFERPDPFTDPTGHFINGQSIRRHSVPKPEKANAVHRLVVSRCGGRRYLVIPIKDFPPDGMILAAPIVLKRRRREAV